MPPKRRINGQRRSFHQHIRRISDLRAAPRGKFAIAAAQALDVLSGNGVHRERHGDDPWWYYPYAAGPPPTLLEAIGKALPPRPRHDRRHLHGGTDDRRLVVVRPRDIAAVCVAPVMAWAGRERLADRLEQRLPVATGGYG